jgi:peptidoglycan hydrolase-like protein with peptidoglycan-binding domain
MKKYFLTLIILAVSILIPLTQHTQAQTLNPQQLSVVVTALQGTGDFSQEQIIQIILTLLSPDSITPATNIEIGSITLPLGELCGFAYNGDESVIAIQQELRNQDYSITKVDGKIGPETRAAVMAFQTANSATKIDGLIGQETRNLLLKKSLRCRGDEGVLMASTNQPVLAASVPEMIEESNESLCRFTYNGDESVMAFQQELQNQGYTITKIDGKIGPETRAAITAFQNTNVMTTMDGLISQDVRIALLRTSVRCDFDIPTMTTNQIIVTNPIGPQITPDSQTPIMQNTIEPNVAIEINSDVGLNQFVIKDEVLAAVRTSGQTADDTAVFTYRLTLNPDSPIFVALSSDATFDISIFNQQGILISSTQSKSIISSAEKILRDDRTSYYRMNKGDSISLRTTAQPGPGVYYAELSRFTYSTQNAQIVANPTVINYGLDATTWRSGTVTLKN